MSGGILLNKEPNDLVPEAAKRALHNMPAFSNKGVVIDLVEYPDFGHVAVRAYQGQLAKLPVEERQKVYERMGMMITILRTFGISASMEKVAGVPPKYER